VEEMKDLKKYLARKKYNRKLVVVFPHPDDEAFATGGLMLVAKKLGWETYVILLTKGGAGKIFINPNGMSAKQLREHEAKKSAKTLKVSKLLVGDFDDGNLKKDKERWSGWLKKQIKAINPSVVVTFDHSGITGHPDHISLSLGVKEVIASMKIKPDLFWITTPEKLKNKISGSELSKYISNPTHKLHLNSEIINKFYAIYSHKSQKTIPFSKLLFLLFMGRVEWYHKVDLEKDYPHKYVKFEI
jgi:LmbE family N-acetylglucosaminyl deacetylase